MKKNGNISLAIITGIVCFILMMVMCRQFKFIYETDVTSIDAMREQELQEQLASWKTKYQEVEEKYVETVNTLNKYKQESTSDSETRKNLEEELENLNLLLGKTDVEGTGVVITVEDGDEKKVDRHDLLIIINYLKEAGAEAISVNEQRVIDRTDFYDINSYIRVNGERITSPYEIKAIGNSDYLKSSLIGNGGYSEIMKANGKKINIEVKRKVRISKYNKEIELKYLEENNDK